MTQHLTFEDFGLHQDIMQVLKEIGFTQPSPIQQQVIPQILSGKDLIGQAQTGTGKTAAFGLPALHLIQQTPGVQLLVMTPTRELATQVSDEIYRLGRNVGVKTVTICGGKSSKNQIDALKRGAQVVVATPGRLLDLLQSQQLPGFQPAIVVLDEADEMLDMGFLEDIEQIFTYLPKKRQTLLFSATMPAPIQQLAKSILHHPLFISATKNETTNQNIEQHYYMIREEERDQAIVRLIDSENPAKAVIFCSTKKEVDRLSQLLVEAGHLVRGLHGDMEQPQREAVIRGFRSEHVRLLVATDVAARGLNVSEISHVFNYHLPFDPASYVHRIGRTGRAGNKGIAVTLVTMRDWRYFQRYEKVLGTKIIRKEMPTLSEVKVIKRRQLAEKILEQAPHEEAHQVLQLLQAQDEATVVSKLISYLLAQQMVMGPDRIGVEPRQPRNESFGKEREGNREGRGRDSRKPKFTSFGSRDKEGKPSKFGKPRTGFRNGFKPKSHGEKAGLKRA